MKLAPQEFIDALKERRMVPGLLAALYEALECKNVSEFCRQVSRTTIEAIRNDTSFVTMHNFRTQFHQRFMHDNEVAIFERGQRKPTLRERQTNSALNAYCILLLHEGYPDYLTLRENLSHMLHEQNREKYPTATLERKKHPFEHLPSAVNQLGHIISDAGEFWTKTFGGPSSISPTK